MKRLRIEHATGFRYLGDVSASYNEARMLPGTTDSQFVLSSSLDIHPSTSVNAYVDYFGTRVSAFDVLSPHTELNITARSLVEVRPRPIEHADISWDRLATESARVIDTVEQLVQTHRTRPHPEVVELAQTIAARHEHPSRAAHDIATTIGDAVEYMHGITGVHSTAMEAWDARKGVCQDISHLTVGMLREMGIPARYVSGYLHPKRSAEIGVSVVGQSHAWVEWWVGRWTAFDPTNGVPIGERHVVVGHGREYGDVPPLKGVYAGPKSTGQAVEVTITRLR